MRIYLLHHRLFGGPIVREEAKSVVVPLSAPDLWDYLADYDKVVRLGWEDASAKQIGASFRCKVRYRVRTVWEGITQDYTACLELAVRPRTLTWSTREALSKSWVRFDLKPVDDTSTRAVVTLHVEVPVRSAESVAWDLLQPSFERTITGLASLGP